MSEYNKQLTKEAAERLNKHFGLSADITEEDYLTLLNFADVRLRRYEEELDRLRRDCAEAYQVIGAMASTDVPLNLDHPDVIRALDNMSAAANKQPRPHDDLLPFPK